MVEIVLEEIDFEVPARFTDGGEFLEEVDLRYALFYGRVTLRADEVTVIGPRTIVPLFDFLACIARSVTSISQGREASFGFTESADRIFFRPLHDGGVEITSSAKDFKVRVDRIQLVEVLAEFLASWRQALIDNVSGIERNPAISKLVPGDH